MKNTKTFLLRLFVATTIILSIASIVFWYRYSVEKVPLQLVELSVAKHSIVPAFEPNTSNYQLRLEYPVDFVQIKAIANTEATITINQTLSSGHKLSVGSNDFIIELSNSSETRGYSLTIVRDNEAKEVL